MESRNNDAPGYLRNENDDLTEDLSQSLPNDDSEADQEVVKNTSPDSETKQAEWKHRLREEMGARREEKDFTD